MVGDGQYDDGSSLLHSNPAAERAGAGGRGYQLQKNNVVVLSSAELYDPGTGAWTGTGQTTTPRVGHTATLLLDGRVLAAGGSGLASAELYDPATGNWTATGSMSAARSGHTATLLANGNVLVVSGCASGTAELYDPATGEWSPAGSVAAVAAFATSLLGNGNVLVAGGHSGNYPNDSTTNSAELFESGSDVWAATGSLNSSREGHTATVLPNGEVVVAGGFATAVNGRRTTLASAELYKP
jgi:N-acetylneuraminic acid mutarotase